MGTENLGASFTILLLIIASVVGTGIGTLVSWLLMRDRRSFLLTLLSSALSLISAVIVDLTIGFLIAQELQSLRGGGDIWGVMALSVAVLAAGPTGAILGVLGIYSAPR
jgi:hypothetical protein